MAVESAVAVAGELSGKDKYIEEVRIRLGEFFAKKVPDEWTNRAVARAIGISHTAISLFKAGKYTGDSRKMAQAIERFLRIQTEKQSAPSGKNRFIKTSVSSKIFEVARTCHVDNLIGVVFGQSGLGKTEALREYARLEPSVILIEADQGYNAQALFSQIHRQLDLGGKDSLHNMVEDVIKELSGSDRMIIIDEAENLQYRALDLIRRVHDKAGVGLLLAGMPRLYENLRGRRGEYVQLYGRISIAVRLSPLTDHDAHALVHSRMPKANAMSSKFFECGKGNARSIVLLIQRAQRIASINNAEVSEEIIDAAASMMMV